MSRRVAWGLLALTGCFTGAGALGLPCENDAQCGRGQTCQGVCVKDSSDADGGSSTSAVTGSSTNAASTTSATTSSSSTSAADTTSASETGTTGDVPACAPVIAPACTLGAPISRRSAITSEEVRSPEGTPVPLSRPSSIVAGDFDGDGRPDLAALDFEFRLHLFLAAEGLGWTEFPDVPQFAAVPYDLVQTDLACDGDTDFVVVTSDNELVVRTFTGTGWDAQVTFIGNPANFSLAVGDLVPDADHLPDIVTAQGGIDPGVLLLRNTGGALVPGTSTSAMVSEPWDTTFVEMPDGPLVLVPQGRNDDDGASVDRVVVFVVAGTEDSAALVAPPQVQLPADFDAPWAVAAGDFVGDDALEIAVGERHVDGPAEQTDTPGTIRFFTYLGRDNDPVWLEQGEVQTSVGLVALAPGDFDCDGRTDLFAATAGSDMAMGADAVQHIIYGAADVDALERIDIEAAGPIAGGSRPAVADFDDDGALEVALADFGALGAPGGRVVIFGLDP